MRIQGRALVLLAALVSTPEAVADPVSATVMVRVVGQVTAAVGTDARVWRPSVELREVQIGTGSGFVVSPAGYVLTASHVIRGGRILASIDGQPVEITVVVQRVLVVVAAPPGAPDATQTFDASVVVDDPATDLAVLHVGVADLPYLGLGDAASLERGDPVTAWGYPLGDRLAVDTGTPGAAPPVSASAGTLAARRDGAPGLPASVPYLQITSPINPGNSGGPVTDADGFVVGIVQAKLRGAEGVAFAISVEEIRRFLERTGIDAALPTTRLSAGLVFDFTAKGLRARVPAGFTDASALRLRADSGNSLGRVRLIVDRLASTWDVARLERELLEGRTLAQKAYRSASDRPRSWDRRAGIRFGLARSVEGQDEGRMMYAIADLGGEQVVARYVASAEDLAFNYSVLKASLLSLEASRLITTPPGGSYGTTMTPVDDAPASAAVPVVPANSTLERTTSPGCAGLPPPAGSIVASPVADFTVRLSATWWPSGVDAAGIARACTAAGSRQRLQYLGLDWIIEQRVVDRGALTPLLLEVTAPAAKIDRATEVQSAWAQALSRAGG